MVSWMKLWCVRSKGVERTSVCEVIIVVEFFVSCLNKLFIFDFFKADHLDDNAGLLGVVGSFGALVDDACWNLRFEMFSLPQADLAPESTGPRELSASSHSLLSQE